ncbi:protein of unknown function [Methanoculleus bourgensis]|uniref:ABC transporter domain-containing protein n=1 Tax=Methanoculleus bourgensis TaxID=83986 RepID=A0A0X3BMS6_9EURY|nr:protein of unknown function [Methanoculleus bourgensis]
MTPLITVKNLCMEFNGNIVLNDINFEIAEGETVGIIGRSGAGKTVLMHLMRGVDQPPSRGSIIYHIAACDACDYVGVPSEQGSRARPAARNSNRWMSISGRRRAHR